GFWVEMPQETDDYSALLTVTNALGKTVLRQTRTVSKGFVCTETWPKGMYVVSLLARNGQRAMEKVVVR
ncbi:MAG: T9SS type A sorting domain-containing protein, partial [Saprospiraceae bacterium]|nr:T9SS type A sorting domain-containing protein [Saprospiraceae bacterium]